MRINLTSSLSESIATWSTMLYWRNYSTAHLICVSVFADEGATADMDQATNPESLKECHELYNSLESWMQRSPGLPSRVHSGNTIYAKAAQVCSCRKFKPSWSFFFLMQLERSFCFEKSLKSIQQTRRCSNVLEPFSIFVCNVPHAKWVWSEHVSLLHQPAGHPLIFASSLIWPVIIAGSHIYGADRTLVTEIFEAFRWVLVWLLRLISGLFIPCRTQCCYEVDTSEEIVQRVRPANGIF